MLQDHRPASAIATILSLCLACALPCLGQETPASDVTPYVAEGAGTISGVVLGVGGKAKTAGAVVHAYHLDSDRVFSSEPTGANGEFVLKGIPSGYLDLAVEVGGEIFVANQVVNMAPSGKMVVRFALAPFGSRDGGTAPGADERRFPGDDRTATGLAEIQKKLRGREFWRSPKGIAIIAGGAGLGLLGIAAGSDPEPLSSAFQP